MGVPIVLFLLEGNLAIWSQGSKCRLAVSLGVSSSRNISKGKDQTTRKTCMCEEADPSFVYSREALETTNILTESEANK